MIEAAEEPVPVRYIEDVQRENAEWVASQDGPLELTVEAAALRSMFAGDAASDLKKACAEVNQSAKWDDAQTQWTETHQDQSAEQLGSTIRAVLMDKFEGEAPHLKPSSIRSRLQSGVPAACFGLFTLMQNMATAAPAGE